MKFIKRHLFPIVYLLLLCIFSVYALLDTFVLAQSYSTVDGTKHIVIGLKGEPIVTDTSYIDENIRVTISTAREYDTNIYVADVVLKDSSVLQTALAENTFGKNITEPTSVIAAEHNAIFAVNGDFYGAQRSGYVVRNGAVYRDIADDAPAPDILVIDKNGDFSIFNERDKTVAEHMENGAVHILSFGPALLIDGENVVAEHTQSSQVQNNKAQTPNPRTAMAQVDTLHYIFVVADGRTDESVGLTCQQLADYMATLGAKTAYNLDGGGSSAMYFGGKLINKPTADGKDFGERSVSDIVYLGY